MTEKLNDRLKSALSSEPIQPEEKPKNDDVEEVSNKKPGVVTTEEEMEAYNIVKAILRDIIDVKRVKMRDTKSYCGILLDDNNRKPICRLHFNSTQKYLGLISNKEEKRVPIDSLDDIFEHADSIRVVMKEYEDS